MEKTLPVNVIQTGIMFPELCVYKEQDFDIGYWVSHVLHMFRFRLKHFGYWKDNLSVSCSSVLVFLAPDFDLILV